MIKFISKENVIEHGIVGNTIVIDPITTIERNELTPEDGMFIYNSTTNTPQVYANGQWIDFGSSVSIGAGAGLSINGNGDIQLGDDSTLFYVDTPSGKDFFLFQLGTGMASALYSGFGIENPTQSSAGFAATNGGNRGAEVEVRYNSVTQQSQFKIQLNTVSGNSLITIDEINGFRIRDDIAQTGLVYQNDYSAIGITNDRWLPDWGAVKQYVSDNVGSTASVGAGAGLSIDANGNIRLGNLFGQPNSVANTDRKYFYTRNDNITVSGNPIWFRDGFVSRHSGSSSVYHFKQVDEFSYSEQTEAFTGNFKNNFRKFLFTNSFVDTAFSTIENIGYSEAQNSNSIFSRSAMVVGSRINPFTSGGNFEITNQGLRKLNTSDYYSLGLKSYGEFELQGEYSFNEDFSEHWFFINPLFNEPSRLERETSQTGLRYKWIHNTNQVIMSFHDPIFQKGLIYASNYFINGSQDDRWIPDWGAVKQYVLDNVGSTASVGAGVGLSIDNNGDIQLGDGSSINFSGRSAPTNFDADFFVRGKSGYYYDENGYDIYLEQFIGYNLFQMTGPNGSLFLNDEVLNGSVDFNRQVSTFHDSLTNSVFFRQFVANGHSRFDLTASRGNFLEQSLKFGLENGTWNATFTDTATNRGLIYGNDYEANFVPRSLITKQYVDGLFASFSVPDAGPGLSIDGNGDIRLGDSNTIFFSERGSDDDGDLYINGTFTNFYNDSTYTQENLMFQTGPVNPSRILTSDFYLNNFSKQSSFQRRLGLSGGNEYADFVLFTNITSPNYTSAYIVGESRGNDSTIAIFNEKGINDIGIFLGTSGTNNMVIRDRIGLKGLIYDNDYEANFVPRSLVTKQYVDGLFASFSVPDAGVGLSIDGNGDIQLGDFDTITFNPNLYVNNISDGRFGVFGRFDAFYDNPLIGHFGQLDTVRSGRPALYYYADTGVADATLRIQTETSNRIFYNLYIRQDSNDLESTDDFDFSNTRVRSLRQVIRQSGNTNYATHTQEAHSNNEALNIIDVGDNNGLFRLRLARQSNNVNSATFFDSFNNRGLEYGGDYEVNFVNRSLITKKYVDDRFVSYFKLDSQTTEAERQQARRNIGSTAGQHNERDTSGIIDNLFTFDKNIIFTGTDPILRGLAGDGGAPIDGEERIIMFRGTGVLTVVEQSVGSNTTARFNTGASAILTPNQSLTYKYVTQGGLNRWVIKDDAILNEPLKNISTTAPATSTSTGRKGTVAYDSTYIYVCVATDTWIRSEIDNTF